MQKQIIILAVLSLNISCENLKDQNVSKEHLTEIDCTLKTINVEIDELSNSETVLDSIFHLDSDQIKQYLSNKFERREREDIILKFTSRLNDINPIKTKCYSTELINLKVGDLAFYCLAKTEEFPFAFATNRQNCTEPNISDEILIPINFIYYTSFERERLTYNYLKYLNSEERQNYIKKKGYD